MIMVMRNVMTLNSIKMGRFRMKLSITIPANPSGSSHAKSLAAPIFCMMVVCSFWGQSHICSMTPDVIVIM